jgi:beta-glucanase (GH16 family)
LLRLGFILIVLGLLAVFAYAKPKQYPAFSDEFTGALDPAKWDVAVGNAPGFKGTYHAENVDFVDGVLRLKLTQSKKGSEGGEIMSKDLFGYGTYTFVMRMSSTASGPTAAGAAVRGSVSAGWNYLKNSETEIDVEFRGDIPNEIRCTNWINFNPNNRKSMKKTTTIVKARPADAFHTYSFLWTPGEIVWYMDGEKIAVNRMNVPSRPAQIRINHWGTDNPNFGGSATFDVTRYMYVKSVNFTPWGSK